MITTDIVRQRRMPAQAPFSDAYINGLPPKRRKVCDHAHREIRFVKHCLVNTRLVQSFLFADHSSFFPL